MYVAVGGVFDYAHRLIECFEPHVRLPLSVPHYRRSSGRRRDLQSKIVYVNLLMINPMAVFCFP